MSDDLEKWLGKVRQAAADDLAVAEEWAIALGEWERERRSATNRLINRLTRAVGGQMPPPRYHPSQNDEERLSDALERLKAGVHWQ